MCTCASIKIPRLVGLAMGLSAALLSSTAVATDTRVLLVGVSDYTDAAITDPAGAAKDVAALRALLVERLDFADGQIRTLTGRSATRAAILDALSNWLLKDVAAGDELLFYFSGHGSNRRDENGDETDDGLDEVLCPADYAQATGENGIADDEIGMLLKTAERANLLVVIDACHSGTATKAAGGRLFDLPLAGRGRTQARFLPPPVSQGTKSVASRRWNSKGITTARDILPPTLSACRDFQRAVSTKFMIGGKLVDHGAFTFMLLQALSGAADADGDSTMTLLELDAFVDRALRQSAYQFEQQPELLVRPGEERRAFLGARLKPRPIELAKLGDDRYRLNLGALDGVASGGRLQIALQDRGIKPNLATVEETDSHSSVLRLEEKPPAALQQRLDAGGRAQVNVAPACPPVNELVLRVWVGSFFEDGCEALPPPSVVNAIGGVEGVKIVRGEEEADRFVVGEYAGTQMKVAIALPSERLVHVLEGKESEIVRKLAEAVEAERLQYALVHTQDPGGAARVRVRTADGRSEYMIRRKGERDYLELEIDVPADGYLMIFDLDSQGGFTRLFPNDEHADSRVSAGRLRVPPPGGFTLPIISPSGRDMIKVIWSRAPLTLPKVDTKSIGHGMLQVESARDAIDLLASLQRDLADAPATKGFVPEAAPGGGLGADLGWSCDAIYIDTFDEQ